MEFISINKINIRLTSERLSHILTNHPEVTEYILEVEKAVSKPDFVFEGSKGEFLSVLKRKSYYFVVIYKENKAKKEGFVITAFITKRSNYLLKKKIIWKKK